MSLIDEWESDAKKYITNYPNQAISEDTYLDLRHFREPGIRILALIYLVRKKDLALEKNITYFAWQQSTNPEHRNFFLSNKEALALTAKVGGAESDATEELK